MRYINFIPFRLQIYKEIMKLSPKWYNICNYLTDYTSSGVILLVISLVDAKILKMADIKAIMVFKIR